MAELYSIGAFRVFGDKEKARIDSDQWERNHEDAVLFTLTAMFIHEGLTKEQASQKAHERLRSLRTQYRSSQEGINGTHSYP